MATWLKRKVGKAVARIRRDAEFGRLHGGLRWPVSSGLEVVRDARRVALGLGGAAALDLAARTVLARIKG